MNGLGYYFTLENLLKGPKVVSQIFKVCHGMMVALLKPKSLKKPWNLNLFWKKLWFFSTPAPLGKRAIQLLTFE